MRMIHRQERRDMGQITYRYLRSWPSLGHCRRNGELVYNPLGWRTESHCSSKKCGLNRNSLCFRQQRVYVSVMRWKRADISDRALSNCVVTTGFIREVRERRTLTTGNDVSERWTVSLVSFALQMSTCISYCVRRNVSSYLLDTFSALARDLEFNFKCHKILFSISKLYILLLRKKWWTTRRSEFQIESQD